MNILYIIASSRKVKSYKVIPRKKQTQQKYIGNEGTDFPPIPNVYYIMKIFDLFMCQET